MTDDHWAAVAGAHKRPWRAGDEIDFAVLPGHSPVEDSDAHHAAMVLELGGLPGRAADCPKDWLPLMELKQMLIQSEAS